MSFLDYARTIVSPIEVEYILAAFGYLSFFYRTNAVNAINIIQSISLPEFSFLHGGLNQIMDRMVEVIGSHIQLGTEVIDVNSNHQVLCADGSVLSGRNIVLAMSSVTLKSLLPAYPIGDQIESIPFCRIYSRFETNWFHGISKFTTDNPLRMFIPIDDHTIMISYSDDVYANYWGHLYHTEGIAGVNHWIRWYLYQVLDLLIPNPIETKVFYWSHGIGIWKVGHTASSLQIADRIHICGADFSANNQGWMEGGIETSQLVFEALNARHQ
jgi:hypothetical protein